jgi:hypothetical protein
LARQCEVLLIEDASTPPLSRLGRRLRGLGFRTRQALDTDELTQLMDRPDLPLRAVLVSTNLPSARLSAFLAPLRRPLAAGEVTGLAVGEAPASEVRERLREAGFTLALWRPFDDRTLRFQVNRAFLRARADGPARGELRAPLPWRVTIHAAGRRKEAQLYSLSQRGGFLETARPSMVGAELDVEFQLTNGPRSLPANVLHTNVTGNLLRPRLPIGMGIRFTDPGPTISDDLAQIVVQRNRDLLV